MDLAGIKIHFKSDNIPQKQISVLKFIKSLRFDIVGNSFSYHTYVLYDNSSLSLFFDRFPVVDSVLSRRYDFDSRYSDRLPERLDSSELQAKQMAIELKDVNSIESTEELTKEQFRGIDRKFFYEVFSCVTSGKTHDDIYEESIAFLINNNISFTSGGSFKVYGSISFSDKNDRDLFLLMNSNNYRKKFKIP